LQTRHSRCGGVGNNGSIPDKHQGCLVRPVLAGRRGRGWKPTYLSRAVRHVFEARREDKSGLHQLRRTFISAVLHNGGDVETARDLAGHSSIVVTQAYVASTNEIKRRAFESLEY
jgi:integrase